MCMMLLRFTCIDSQRVFLLFKLFELYYRSIIAYLSIISLMHNANKSMLHWFSTAYFSNSSPRRISWEKIWCCADKSQQIIQNFWLKKDMTCKGKVTWIKMRREFSYSKNTEKQNKSNRAYTIVHIWWISICLLVKPFPMILLGESGSLIAFSLPCSIGLLITHFPVMLISSTCYWPKEEKKSTVVC
jgi:hypothetical protein